MITGWLSKMTPGTKEIWLSCKFGGGWPWGMSASCRSKNKFRFQLSKAKFTYKVVIVQNQKESKKINGNHCLCYHHHLVGQILVLLLVSEQGVRSVNGWRGFVSLSLVFLQIVPSIRYFNYTTDRCVFSRSNTETYRLTKHFTTKNNSQFGAPPKHQVLEHQLRNNQLLKHQLSKTSTV